MSLFWNNTHNKTFFVEPANHMPVPDQRMPREFRPGHDRPAVAMYGQYYLESFNVVIDDFVERVAAVLATSRLKTIQLLAVFKQHVERADTEFNLETLRAIVEPYLNKFPFPCIADPNSTRKPFDTHIARNVITKLAMRVTRMLCTREVDHDIRLTRSCMTLNDVLTKIASKLTKRMKDAPHLEDELVLGSVYSLGAVLTREELVEWQNGRRKEDPLNNSYLHSMKIYIHPYVGCDGHTPPRAWFENLK